MNPTMAREETETALQRFVAERITAVGKGPVILAREHRLPKDTISDLLHGRRAAVSSKVLGQVAAALHPVQGAGEIARYLAGLTAMAADGSAFLERTVNGQPGLVAQENGVTVTVFAFDIAGGKIARIWAIRNPDKLRPWRAPCC